MFLKICLSKIPNFKRKMIYKPMSKSVISGFRREVDENCALLGYYAASSGNFVNTANLVHSFS